jgi:hypothetical protein
VGVILERPFLWMTERQRQELRLQASRIVAMAVAPHVVHGCCASCTRPGRHLLHG